MKRTCYQLQENKRITAVSCQNNLPHKDETRGEYWMEIASSSDEELSALLTALDLHPLIIEDCLTLGYSTMIDRYETAVYFEFPITQYKSNNSRTTYLSLIYMSGLLITIRRGEILGGMESIAEALQRESILYANDTLAVVYEIFSYFIAKDITAIRLLRDRVDEITHALEESITAVEAETVSALHRHVSRLSDISEDRFYTLKSLLVLRSEPLQIDNDKPYIHNLVSDAEYGFRMLQRLEDRLRDLRTDFQLKTHDETEKRLRILTVISAVLLPLTLISGIFGMNFDNMDFLHWQYGYSLIMMAMGLIVVVMMIYFRHHGWFD